MKCTHFQDKNSFFPHKSEKIHAKRARHRDELASLEVFSRKLKTFFFKNHPSILKSFHNTTSTDIEKSDQVTNTRDLKLFSVFFRFSFFFLFPFFFLHFIKKLVVIMLISTFFKIVKWDGMCGGWGGCG